MTFFAGPLRFFDMSKTASGHAAGSVPRRSRWRVALRLVVVGLLGCAIGPFTTSGCRSEGASNASDGVQVVATTAMIADIARRVAGEHADVTSLMGPGIDPHLYRPSAGDVARLSAADLILYNGLALEGKMAAVLEKQAALRPVIAVADAVPKEKLLTPPEFEGSPDPHVWFDPSLWALTVDPMVKALAKLLPEAGDALRRNGEQVKAELAALDTESEKALASIAKEQRVLVTAHDAFGYFGRRYGFEVVGLQGLSTASKAGIQDVQRIVDLLVTRKIKAIFVESSVPERSLRAVVEASEEKGHKVVVGGQLFSDAMGAAGTAEGTYDGMVRHNVKTLVNALR